MTRARLGYVPALDGLRALAVGLVILFHATVPHFWGGYLGVDIFFVLSGFLITTLLLEEFNDTGRIHLWRFYARRALRLYPALLLMLLFYAVTLPGKAAHWGLKDATITALYLSDYAMTLGYTPLLSPVSHTWTLAVEEHFYILWPFVLLWLRRRYPGRKLVPVLGWSYLAATAWEFANIFSGLPPKMVDFRFDTQMNGLLLGAFLSVFLLEGGKVPRLRAGLAASTLLLAATVFSLTQADVIAWGICMKPVAQIFAFFAIAAVVSGEGGLTRRLLSWAPAIAVGRISYGLYLFHWGPAYSMRLLYPWPETLAFTVAVGGSLSLLSYFTVEQAARHMKARFAVEKAHASAAGTP